MSRPVASAGTRALNWDDVDAFLQRNGMTRTRETLKSERKKEVVQVVSASTGSVSSEKPRTVPKSSETEKLLNNCRSFLESAIKSESMEDRTQNLIQAMYSLGNNISQSQDLMSTLDSVSLSPVSPKSPSSSNTSDSSVYHSIISALVYYLDANHVPLPDNLVEDILALYHVDRLEDLYRQDLKSVESGVNSDCDSEDPNSDHANAPSHDPITAETPVPAAVAVTVSGPPTSDSRILSDAIPREGVPTRKAVHFDVAGGHKESSNDNFDGSIGRDAYVGDQCSLSSEEEDEDEVLVQYFCKNISESQYQALKDKENFPKVDLPSHNSVEYPELLCYDLPLFYHYHSTGFEPTSEFICAKGMKIINRYQMVKPIGEAAFSNTVECKDLETQKSVCLKILKNNKDYIEQGYDEIKVLKELNDDDADQKYPIVRLHSSFYYKEHLIIVSELLGKNLYDFSQYIKKANRNLNYFTLDRLRFVTRQIVQGLAYIHSHNLIHCDLKPENIAIVDAEKATVKIIDLGSACYNTNRLNIYAQSRSYRAPEIILGLDYDSKVDIWSLGCIVAELFCGELLFDNSSVAGLLASAIAIVGDLPPKLIKNPIAYSKYFVGPKHQLYLHEDGNYTFLIPDKTTLGKKLNISDANFLSFLSEMLEWDPSKRATAEQLLKHPFLSQKDDKLKIHFDMSVVKEAYTKRKTIAMKQKRKNSF